MNTHQYNQYLIHVSDEPAYRHNPADIISAISIIYFGRDAHECPTSHHSIRITKDSETINECLVVGSGGATTIHAASTLIKNDRILVCCCNSVFCINLISLEIAWINEFDPATCFQIFHLEDDLICHGEMTISRFNIEGELIWEFRGEDIFASIDNPSDFRINESTIELCDFENTIYNLDFDGKLLSKIGKSKITGNT